MNLARVVRKIAAFFARDFAIARGYRGALVLETLEALFGVATFYYLSRFVSSPELSSALPDGGNYFAFALVGFAFFDYLSVSLTAFDSSIEEARQNRTLEALLVTQTPLSVILAGSALYPFLAALLRVAVYVAWGTALFGFPLRNANWVAVCVVLLATLIGQGGTLPWLIRWLKIKDDGAAVREERLAIVVTARAGLHCIDRLEKEGTYPADILGIHRFRLEARLGEFTSPMAGKQAA